MEEEDIICGADDRDPVRDEAIKHLDRLEDVREQCRKDSILDMGHDKLIALVEKTHAEYVSAQERLEEKRAIEYLMRLGYEVKKITGYDR